MITFPVIPRKWVEACGHYAGILHIDTWWQEVGRALGIDEWIDVHIEHLSYNQFEGVRPGVPDDSVYRERVFTLHELSQPPLYQMHARDVEIVRSLIG